MEPSYDDPPALCVTVGRTLLSCARSPVNQGQALNEIAICHAYCSANVVTLYLTLDP